MFGENGRKAAPPLTVSKILPDTFESVLGSESKIKKVISSLGYTCQSQRKNGGLFFSASKNKWGILGGPLIHFGLVLALIGGLLTFLFSNVREFSLPEGETMEIQGIPGKIRLEKFSVLLHPGKMQPEEYVGQLMIENPKQQIERYELKVNRPLRIGWTKLFLMRYHFEILRIDVSVYRKEKLVEQLSLKMDEAQKLRHDPYEIEFNDFVPDFVINKEGQVTSRSPYFVNPAVRIAMRPSEKPEEKPLQVWAFRDLAYHQGGKTNEWSFVVDKIKKRYVSGIKLSRDPGIFVAYAGFSLLVLGTFISGFVLHRRLELYLLPAQAGIEMTMLGYSPKDRTGLEYELNRIQKELLFLFQGARA